MRKQGFVILLALWSGFCLASSEGAHLEKARIDLTDHASLQRGARLYMNYCSGCHSLQYMRFKRLAKDIGIVDAEGQVDEDLVLKNLIFTDANIGDPLTIAMPKANAKEWFGKAPPDLTLEARVRGADWIYSYLRSFYKDPNRPWGVNNWVFKDVAMPNVLAGLQGEQVPYYRTETIIFDGEKTEVKVIDHLQQLTDGLMTPHQFDAAVNDLVNFLVYVAEPIQTTRKRVGVWVILFLTVFAALAYALKKEFWKDVK